jgi:hypothetical protein
MKLNLLAALCLTLVTVTGCVNCAQTVSAPEPELADNRNLLVNAEFNFHSLIPQRYGKPSSCIADYVPYWNAATAKSLRVIRDSHIDKKYLPDFSVPNGVELLPGQSFHQFFTLYNALGLHIVSEAIGLHRLSLIIIIELIEDGERIGRIRTGVNILQHGTVGRYDEAIIRIH